MVFLEKVSRILNQILVWIGCVFLAAMILLTCSNIFLRIVWLPIKGTFELMGYFGAVVTAFALGYTQIGRGHIAVNVLTNTFSQKTQRVLAAFNSLICMGFFIFAAWQVAKWATTLWETGEVTETLRIIYYPFTYCLALGCAVLALVFLTDFMKSILPKKEEAK
jgi:TRAP-type C4-dicarboxylate transport system permease small subunit